MIFLYRVMLYYAVEDNIFRFKKIKGEYHCCSISCSMEYNSCEEYNVVNKYTCKYN